MNNRFWNARCIFPNGKECSQPIHRNIVIYRSGMNHEGQKNAL